MNRRKLSLNLKGVTPEQAAIVARKEPVRTERGKEEEEIKKLENVSPTEPVQEIDEVIEEEVSVEAQKEGIPPIPKKKPKKTAKAAGRKKRQKAPVEEALVTQTFRLPQSLSEKLQIFSMNQKVKKLYPSYSTGYRG